MSDERRGEPLTEGHEPPAEGSTRDEASLVRETRGHQPPPLTRGHEPPDVSLGHPPPDIVALQPIGEMHSPAEDSPPPVAPPTKPSDAAQSVQPPSSHADGNEAPSGESE
jgi:hypothetical protein